MSYKSALFARLCIALTLTITLFSSPAQAATITVNSLADPGLANDALCTLREAINNVNAGGDTDGAVAGGCIAATGGDSIIFSVNGTITLASTLPGIAPNPVTITGPGPNSLTIQFNNTAGWNFSAAGSTLSGVTITGAKSAAGVITIRANSITLDNLNISNNVATSYGGGIGVYLGAGSVIRNSTISNNSAPFAAAIVVGNIGVSVEIINCTITGNINSVLTEGVVVSLLSAQTTIRNATIHANTGLGIGAFHATFGAGTVNINNSIVSSSSAGDCVTGGTLTSNGYNLFSDATCVAVAHVTDL